MVDPDSESVTVTANDDVLIIELDRPDKRNALDIELITSLRDLLAELNADPNHGILLTGSGPVTTAGADTAIVGGDDEEQKRELIAGINEVYELLEAYPRPTVMAAKGAAVGAGFQLAMVCDFTVVGDETELLKPEIKYGVFSGYSTAMLEATVGNQIAREIALRGDAIQPEQALAWGLVSDVVPEADVDARARELLDQLTDYDSTAYAKTKEVLRFEVDRDEFEQYP